MFSKIYYAYHVNNVVTIMLSSTVNYVYTEFLLLLLHQLVFCVRVYFILLISSFDILI